MKLVSINPSNNEVLGEVEESTQEEITAIVKQAHQAKDGWKNLGIEGRNKILRNFYDLLEKYKQELAELQAVEMGMPISESVGDIEGSLTYLRWYSDNVQESLAPVTTYEDANEIHTVYREPRGVVASIIPWNFPLANFVWQCGQSLVVGNVVVLKHSEEVPLFEKRLEEIAREAKIPNGVLSFVYGDGKVGDMLAHAQIDMLCFTGSTKVGKYLYTVAAEKFIPVVMEMGGSAPGIVFADANLESVIDTIYLARFMGGAQMCDGLKRLIVHKSRLDEVVGLLKEKLNSKKIGLAIDPTTEVGPLVAERQVKALEIQVEDARKKGANIIVGGKRPNGLDGAYYEQTLITGIKKDMKVWTEETFGPVLPIISFETEDEAIELANDTKYGLGSYVFTSDKACMSRVASKIQSGMVSQNNLSYIKPYNPFGGYKQSGIGREHGKYGFEDLTQVKVIASEK
jgi:succinate-semialdehyde dehydrogenase/glutarate-semialdehyde dehydrogenase